MFQTGKYDDMLINETSAGYVKLDSINTPIGTLTSWKYTHPDAPSWNNFLASTLYGHFYQTSMWAEVKKLDGWDSFINLITLNDTIVGGFQMLTRTNRLLGKIGIVLKGPVVISDDDAVMKFAISTLRKAVQKNRIRALIVQPPDRDKKIQNILREYNFSYNHIDYVISENTVSLDLRKNEDEILKGIKRTKKQNINSAVRQGVKVLQGNRDNLETFYRLMTETCRRQQVAPSPSNVNIIFKIWDCFSPRNNIKLFMSEYEGEILSCLVVLSFGHTAYLWKFGWSGKHQNVYPNVIIYWEIFKWAKENGFCFADMGAIGRDLADKLDHGEAVTGDMSKTYSYFKTCFGGEILHLTKGFVYIDNPVIRSAYNLLMPHINSIPFLKRKFLFTSD